MKCTYECEYLYKYEYTYEYVFSGFQGQESEAEVLQNEVYV